MIHLHAVASAPGWSTYLKSSETDFQAKFALQKQSQSQLQSANEV